jgi:hypothetical protein
MRKRIENLFDQIRLDDRDDLLQVGFQFSVVSCQKIATRLSLTEGNAAFG